jgi:hypothetical protein
MRISAIVKYRYSWAHIRIQALRGDNVGKMTEVKRRGGAGAAGAA